MIFEWLEVHQLPCLFKEIWGIECPGCGFQTAVLLLLKGEFQAAVVTWPGLLPFFLFVLFIFGRMSGIKRISVPLLKGTGIFCLAVMFLSYIFRLFYNP